MERKKNWSEKRWRKSYHDICFLLIRLFGVVSKLIIVFLAYHWRLRSDALIRLTTKISTKKSPANWYFQAIHQRSSFLGQPTHNQTKALFILLKWEPQKRVPEMVCVTRKWGKWHFIQKRKERKIYFLAVWKDTENAWGTVPSVKSFGHMKAIFFLVESSHKFVKDFTRCEKLSTPMQELGAILHSPMYLLLYNLECDC